MAFWCGTKGVMIVFHARSTSYFHELMISLATHRITLAPSVSPPPASHPAPLDPMVVLFPQEPPERPVTPTPQEVPERPNSPTPQLNRETNPFRGEPRDNPPPYQQLNQPVGDFDTNIVPSGVPFQIPCPICHGSIERSEVHRHGERDIMRQGSDIDLMTHQLHPFIITRVVPNSPSDSQARSPIIPPSLYRENTPPSYIDSHNDQLLPIPVAPHLAESLDIPDAQS